MYKRSLNSKIEKSNSFLAKQIYKRYNNCSQSKDLKSFEWYDIWDTPFGRVGKKLYLKNNAYHIIIS